MRANKSVRAELVEAQVTQAALRQAQGKRNSALWQ